MERVGDRGEHETRWFRFRGSCRTGLDDPLVALVVRAEDAVELRGDEGLVGGGAGRAGTVGFVGIVVRSVRVDDEVAFGVRIFVDVVVFHLEVEMVGGTVAIGDVVFPTGETGVAAVAKQLASDYRGTVADLHLSVGHVTVDHFPRTVGDLDVVTVVDAIDVILVTPLSIVLVTLSIVNSHRTRHGSVQRGSVNDIIVDTLTTRAVACVVVEVVVDP